MNALDVLRERGFVYQVSDEAGLRAAFECPLTLYWGYDPTDPSLHTGNLVSIMALKHLQAAGHRPIALAGGGTGMVGDPSDKSSARPVMSIEQIDANVRTQTAQLSRYLDFGEGKALLVNNADWLRSVRYVDFLRDVGRHFSINVMLDLEFVRTRLASRAGLTYLEFSYILLQAYDFLELYRRQGCTLQIGGSDQWANILAGADLVRRVEGGKAYALVTPLVTASSGRKLSKSEGTAIYLDPARTSPYEYYQYWVNTEDADVARYLALYTLLPMDEVRRLGSFEGAGLRESKEILAFEATTLTHGGEQARAAQDASRALFGGRILGEDGVTFGGPTLVGGATAIPTTEIAGSNLADDGIALTDLLVRAGLMSSKREARQRIGQGAARVHDEQVHDEHFRVTYDHVKDGSILLRVGKKFHRVVVT